MVAAQKFNEQSGQALQSIYGSVSNGIQWQFLKLEGSQVHIDLNMYFLPPVDQILGYFTWMITG